MKKCDSCGLNSDDKNSFCPECGEKLSDNAELNFENQFQDNTNKKETDPFYANMMRMNFGGHINATNVIIWSVIVMIIFNMLFGVLALVTALSIKKAYEYEQALQLFKRARLLCILGTTIGFTINLLLVIYLLMTEPAAFNLLA